MPTDLPTSAAPQGAVRLDDWGVIRAQGEEAAKFLHGQLTQDIEHLPVAASRLAGYCSAKGRLLATFVVWRPAADEVLLACSADLLPVVLKRLAMFVMRTKCRLSDASADKPLWGLAGDVAAAALGSAVPVRDGAVAQVDAAEVLRLPDAIVGGAVVPRFLWAGGDVPALPAISAESWRWLEVMSGTPRVVAATAEQFVPQMVNLELVGGVNFKKGCYPGQEVVARSQYRGTLKRRATIVEGDALLQPGQEIFHSGDPGQPAGMVVLGGSLAAHRHAALVELKIAALQDGTLHAGSADGPVLRAAPLPYSMPAEAA